MSRRCNDGVYAVACGQRNTEPGRVAPVFAGPTRPGSEVDCWTINPVLASLRSKPAVAQGAAGQRRPLDVTSPAPASQPTPLAGVLPDPLASDHRHGSVACLPRRRVPARRPITGCQVREIAHTFSALLAFDFSEFPLAGLITGHRCSREPQGA